MADTPAHVIGPGAVRLERRLPGPIDRVWAYLTDPELRATWLAGGPMEGRVGGAVTLRFRHADLSSEIEDVPERYRHMAEREHVMAGTVTAWEPPHRLRYTWDDAGECSEVTFDLRADGAEVLLVVTQRRLDGRAAMISVSGGWHAHVDILRDRLEGREPPGFWGAHARAEGAYAQTLADERERIAPEGAGHLTAADDGRPLLRFVRELGAGPEAAWEALTAPEMLDRWYPARLRMEGRVGGWVRETFDEAAEPLPDGTLLALEPPRHLAFDLHGDPGSADEGVRHTQRLAFTLSERDGGCTLVFEHAIGDRRLAPGLAAGWHACLDALAGLVDAPGRAGDETASRDAELRAAYASWFGDAI
jgi:uncharacterized protein YndB with AHSA1/START domain